jgi:cytochrome c556
MKFRVALAAFAVMAVGAGASLAQPTDVIASRIALMKANADHSKEGAGMVRGTTPFDLKKAQAIFQAYEDTAAKLPSLYPATAKTGGETTAAPAIWDDAAGWKAAITKFGADAKAAKASVKDLDTFKAGFMAIQRNCGSCHQTYRIKKT